MAKKPFLEILQERFHVVLTKQLLPGLLPGKTTYFINNCMKIYEQLYPQYKKERKKADIYEAFDQFVYALRQYGASFNPDRYRDHWYKNYEVLSKFFVVPKDFATTFQGGKMPQKKNKQ